VILAGRPIDSGWDDVLARAEKVMASARRQGTAKGIFNPKNVWHRRGNFAVLGDGVSFGGGQKVGFSLSCFGLF
jgi:hypothetical protein